MLSSLSSTIILSSTSLTFWKVGSESHGARRDPCPDFGQRTLTPIPY
jgi:hypothetical protein